MGIALPVLGGLGLFLYGMNLMGEGLQKAAGSKLKGIIEKLTSNKLMGVLVGTIVTMIIQSSGATTVMVIGFVNANLMTLTQAASVIMGANVGTTITAQIIAFNLTDYAPIAVIVGVGLWLMASKKKSKDIAEILIGIGILFIGMGMMSDGLKPLADIPGFSKVMISLNNPLLGMLAGLILTTIVQSSSAFVGLLQALASQGLVQMNIAYPILFGSNIGSTTTALISSVGANKTAKRAALIHFLFNIIGTIIFLVFLRLPVEYLVTRISPDNVSRQIANAHTIFNIINIMIQFPFINQLVKIVEYIIPGTDKSDKKESIYLDYRIIETPSIALGQVNKEILHMGDLVLKNMSQSKLALVDGKDEYVDKVLEREKTINELEKEITEYLVQLSNASLSDEQHGEVNILLYTISDIERVGDHLENIVELEQYNISNNISFSELAKGELNEMFEICMKSFTTAMSTFEKRDEDLARKVMTLEDEVDRLEKRNRSNHIERLNNLQCEAGPGIIFLDAISNLERVSDHSLNIAMYVYDKLK